MKGRRMEGRKKRKLKECKKRKKRIRYGETKCNEGGKKKRNAEKKKKKKQCQTVEAMRKILFSLMIRAFL
jgi:hypothetical protein